MNRATMNLMREALENAQAELEACEETYPNFTSDSLDSITSALQALKEEEEHESQDQSH